MPDNMFSEFADQTSEDQSNQNTNMFAEFAPGVNQSQEQSSNGNAPILPTKQGTFWDNIDILNRNFANVGNGGLQMAAQGLQALGIDTSGFQKNIAQQQAVHERDYNQALQDSPISGTITDIGSKIGAAVATPGTQPLLGAQALTGAGRILQTAGASAIAGGSEYVPESESRIDNALQSGFIGGALGAAGEGLMAGAKAVAPKLFNTPVQEAAISADEGLLTTVGSATGNPSLQGVEDVLGRVSLVGTKGAINKQVGKLQQQATSVLDDIGVGSQSKVDLGEELGSAIKSSFQQATANTNKAYSEALDIASKNKINIPLQETQSVAQQALGQIDELKKAGISSADISHTQVGKLLDDIVKLPEGEIPAKSFDVLRKKIGAIKLGEDSEGLAPILKQIKSSMDTDLEAVGGSNKVFGDALLKARNTFISEKAPFQNVDVLNKALTGRIDTDQLLNTIVQSDRPVLTKNVMDALSIEGKQAFSKAIINKTVKNAIGADEILDLGKFSNQLHKLGETISALPKMEQMKIQGLQKLLIRADNMIKTNKISSNTLGNWLGGSTLAITAGLGNIPAALGMAGFTKGLSYAMTSPKLTKMLIKLAGGKMAQTAQDGIVKAAIKTMIRKGTIPAAASAVPTGNNDNKQNRQPVEALGILG